MNVIINPGSGPVEGASIRSAIANTRAFVAELGHSSPRVTVRRERRVPDGGRYAFTLTRGVREVAVDMPGIPLDRVRYVKGRNAWTFPRLYVDGSSWLWEFAVDIARGLLVDHDGAIGRQISASLRRCRRAVAKQSRCATCNTVLSIEAGPHVQGGDRYDSEYVIRCLECVPDISEYRMTPCGATYIDDGWKNKSHYFMRKRRLAPEVPGADSYAHPDALCRPECRRKYRHEGPCEPYWKILERTYVPGRDDWRRG